ncbi:MAG: HlyD family efflux transporter periplasmic adaptor subunit [bacterium]|nr:HlyD family efflux transporter periplasmic adaptor subunit [bacterium]
MIPDTEGMDRPVERGRTLNRWVVAAGAVVVLGMAIVLLRPAVSRWMSTDRSVARAQLRFATVTRGDLEYTVAVQGRVVAASQPTIFSPADGIVSIKVREGQQVEAGDVLAIVESPELESRLRQEAATSAAFESDMLRLELSQRQQSLENQQAVELAAVQKAAAGRMVERNQRLFDLGLVNQIDLETSKDDLRVAELELIQAEQRIELERDMRVFALADARSRLDRQKMVAQEFHRQVAALELVAPFAGLVATLSAEDRDAVFRNQALVGVVDLSDLEVEIGIPESSADEVAPGVAAVVTVDGSEHRGVLTRIAPAVVDGQVLGRVVFSEGVPAGLRQNQRVSTRLVLEHRENVLKVPRGPFLEGGGGTRAYLVADDLAQLCEIRVGAVSVGEVEIVAGLEPGDEIILSDMSRFDGADTVLLWD